MELRWVNLKAKCINSQTLETIRIIYIPSPEILVKWDLGIHILTHTFLPKTPRDSDVGVQQTTWEIL